jgi:hypothetical protein
VQEAARLVRTLRSAGRDAKPVAVLVLPSDVELAANTTAFQRVIPYQPKRHVRDGMDAFARTDHERFNILPRLRAVDYAPWAEFIMLDTDVLCSAPTDGVWAAFRRSGQAVAAPGLAVDCKWHFGTVCDVSKGLRLTSQLPHVHAGAVYVNTAPDSALGPVLAKFRADTVAAFTNYDSLGFKRWFRQKSRVLEICYSYAFSRAGRVVCSFEGRPLANPVRLSQ